MLFNDYAIKFDTRTSTNRFYQKEPSDQRSFTILHCEIETLEAVIHVSNSFKVMCVISIMAL